MASYNFTKVGIEKPLAFHRYLQTNFAYYSDFTYTDPDLSITATIVLDGPQYAALQTLVDNYVDPAVFLILDTTTTDACRSAHTSSSTLENVLSFIFSPTNPLGDSTFNALKTVLEYSTDDIALFATGSTAATVAFSIFDYSRNVEISSAVLDISDVLAGWQAQAPGTGPAYELRSFMVEGLRNVIANYDCIWQFKISVTNPNVKVRTNSMQRLYYHLL